MSYAVQQYYQNGGSEAVIVRVDNGAGLAALTLPWFNQLAGKTMIFPWKNPVFWNLSLTCTLLSGLLAGSYPAFYLSGFRPVEVLKGAFKAGKGARNPRKILVVTQFSISLALIIGTIVVFRQIQFAKDQPLGYDQAGLITVPDNTRELDTHFEALRNGLLKTGVVANIANSSMNLNGFYQNNILEWEGMSEEAKTLTFRDIFVNADFGPTIGWTIVQGRDFSRTHITDSTAAIVNETGARILGFKDPSQDEREATPRSVQSDTFFVASLCQDGAKSK